MDDILIINKFIEEEELDNENHILVWSKCDHGNEEYLLQDTAVSKIRHIQWSDV